MNDNPLVAGKEYAFKLGGMTVFGRIEKVLHRIEINTFGYLPANQLGRNEIVVCRVVVNTPIVIE